VPAQVIDGKAVAAEVRSGVAGQVEEFAASHDGRVPGLATVLVGDDPASQVYVGNKRKQTEDVGMRSIHHGLDASIPQDELLALIAELDADEEVDGILVQLPLPDQIDQDAVIGAIDPAKDVDGLHPFNAGQLYLGEPTYVGGTPLGVIALLDEYGIQLAGARAVVVGRSVIVGKPMAHLLLQANATVTICHSKTVDLGAHTREADVLVVAVGHAGLVTPGMVKPGAAVVDVGMNRTEEGLRGDVDPAVADVAGYITPVPGGVGPMTIATLLRNAVRAARYRRGVLAFPRT
jgi:methylenetetrahydrofolate dehydrogenase (NADP+)/methenyltetrahydrofolate cyclohydrolase